MNAPLLSIVIPTYNRCVWLDSLLYLLIPQIKDLNGSVELIVSNNASTDNTEAVIDRYYSKYPFICNTNPENIGAIRNIFKGIKLSTGNFVWVLGDDDFVRPKILNALRYILQENHEISLLYIPMVFWASETEYAYPDDILYDIRDYLIDKSDIKYRFTKYNTIKEIATPDKGYFNAISNFILRRKDYYEAFKIGENEIQEFSSIQTTFPHAYYIAKNLMSMSCVCLDSPGVVCSGKVTWGKYYEITWLKWYPELIIMMSTYGADRYSSRLARVGIINRHYYEMIPKLYSGKIEMYEYFSWFKYYTTNLFFYAFWRIHLSLISRFFRKFVFHS